MCCRYGSSSEDVDMGRWVKHAESKHNITVTNISWVEMFFDPEDWYDKNLTTK